MRCSGEMATYSKTRETIENKIKTFKLIHNFRTYLYSLNRDSRQKSFMICYDFLYNELNNSEKIITKKEETQRLLNHWNWNDFDTHSVDWWRALLESHVYNKDLYYLLKYWVDDFQLTNVPSINDTESLGLR